MGWYLLSPRTCSCSSLPRISGSHCTLFYSCRTLLLCLPSLYLLSPLFSWSQTILCFCSYFSPHIYPSSSSSFYLLPFSLLGFLPSAHSALSLLPSFYSSLPEVPLLSL